MLLSKMLFALIAVSSALADSVCWEYSMTKAELASAALVWTPWDIIERDLFQRVPLLSKGHMGFYRSDMPQIDTLEQMKQFIEIVHNLGYETNKTIINIRETNLIPTQIEANADKILDICESKNNPTSLVPIILVSGNTNDMRILDGHHRAMAKLGCEKNPITDVLIISRQENSEEIVKKIYDALPVEFFANYTMN